MIREGKQTVQSASEESKLSNRSQTRGKAVEINLKLFHRFSELFQMSEGEICLDSGASVRDLLNILCDTEERSRKIFASDKRTLLPNVVIRKNGRFIVHLNWLDTGLEEGDRVEILSLYCGG
jgi:sulfur carrier protein ThiS